MAGVKAQRATDRYLRLCQPGRGSRRKFRYRRAYNGFALAATVIPPLRWFHSLRNGVGSVHGELRLQLSEEGADAVRLAELTGYLRAELLQLDVEDVTAMQAGEPPPGARVVGVAAVGGLLRSLRKRQA